MNILANAVPIANIRFKTTSNLSPLLSKGIVHRLGLCQICADYQSSEQYLVFCVISLKFYLNGETFLSSCRILSMKITLANI